MKQLFFGLSGLVLWACSTPLNILGVESTNTEHDDGTGTQEAALQTPEFDPTLTIDEEFDGCKVRLNKSASVTQLDVGRVDSRFQDKLYPTRALALAALQAETVIPSMEVVNGWLKPFNDGLYAAVELAADQGSDSSLVDRKKLLNDLLAALLDRASKAPAPEQGAAQEAAAQVAGALRASGETPALPGNVDTRTTELLKLFDEDTFHSLPTGFYTWTPALESVFRSERFMGYSPLSFGASAAIALRTSQAPALHDAYSRYLGLFQGLTNTFRDQHPLQLEPLFSTPAAFDSLQTLEGRFRVQYPTYGLNDPTGTSLVLLPPSISPETELFDRMAAQGTLVEGNLFDALIDAIKQGKVDLTPSADSGWYARQLWALETLLLPERGSESSHLRLTQAYKDKLVESFRSMLVQTRETHARQLATTAVSVSAPAKEVYLYPQLPVEPFPTFYLRTARAYAFLEGLLNTTMGEAFMGQARRVNEEGNRGTVSLKAELETRMRILYGLHVVAARSIGMRHEISNEEAARFVPTDCEAEARTWLTTWAGDTDLARDNRVVVPISRNLDANTSTYWATVGVRAIRMRATFAGGREPTVVTIGGCYNAGFVAFEPYLLVDQTVEVVRKATAKPLTRAELRKRCDANTDVASISRALGQE